MPPVKKMPLACSNPLQAVGFLAVAPRIEVHHRDVCGTEFAKQAFVTRAGFVHAARRRDHDDIGLPAAGNLNETPEDLAIVLLILCAADRNDPAARFAFRNSAGTHLGPFSSKR